MTRMGKRIQTKAEKTEMLSFKCAFDVDRFLRLVKGESAFLHGYCHDTSPPLILMMVRWFS